MNKKNCIKVTVRNAADAPVVFERLVYLEESLLFPFHSVSDALRALFGRNVIIGFELQLL